MFLKHYRPTTGLDAYIESFLIQEDLNPSNFANRNPVKVLPTTLAVIGLQYGQPMHRVENGIARPMGASGLTGLQTTYREYLSTGLIGTIIIRFKPGGLARFTPYPIQEFQDANVPLECVFPASRIHEMEERLQAAADAEERIAIVERFLISVMPDRYEDRLVLETARRISVSDGRVSVSRLANDLFMSKRTLERKFNSLIGAPPKRFASIVRFQKAIALRKAGFYYPDIIFACGYTDQAHFINDFRLYAGCSPERFFRDEVQPELSRSFNENGQSVSLKESMYQ